jgi:tetratricopeptide (TPR) repeat protein
LLVVLVLLGVVFLWSITRRSGGHYLAAEAPAVWIAYPGTFDPGMRPTVDHTTEFRRSFRVDGAPERAMLRIRAFRRATVSLNGEIVARRDTADADWTQPLEVDVGQRLRIGENELNVRVANDLGPPALWLALDFDRTKVSSDAGWSSSLLGAAWLPARPLDEPRPILPGNALAGGERTLDGLWSQSDTLVGLAILVTALLALNSYLGSHPLPAWVSQRRLLAAGIVAAWLVLFLNNAETLSAPIGFDAIHHMEYVTFIHDQGRLPLANQGLEMQQPPLYYIVCSGALRVCGVPADGGVACIGVLQAVGFATGLVGIGLVALVLGRLFRDQIVPQAVGTVTAAALPMYVYESQYLSNDLLAGVLATLFIYLSVRVVQSPRPSLGLLCALGVSLGAAVLTKLTALPAAVAVFMILFATAALRSRSLWSTFRTAGLPLVVSALVCGWYFWRNYKHFGRPLVGSYEQDIYPWWQDPGELTLGQIRQFGTALISPFYSVTQGVADGLYSTLWGDGACGGKMGFRRPPWRYELMAAGYLLALVPSALAAIGGGAMLVRWVRRPTPEISLLLLLPMGAVAAIFYLYAHHPYYCHIKAFYALPAVAALCAFVGQGFDLVTRRSKWVLRGLGVLFGTWALAAMVSFLIPDSAETLVWLGWERVISGDVAAAEAKAQQALKLDASSTKARMLNGELLIRSGRLGEAAFEFRKLFDAAPDSPEVGVELARVLALRGQTAQARGVLEGIVKQPTDSFNAYYLLAQLREANQDYQGMVQATRDGLRVSPANPDLHVLLARGLVRIGEPADALSHYRIAFQFAPNSLPAMLGQAWLLAAHEDARIRDGAAAVRLADRAIQQTEARDVRAWRVLAAAVAETGDFLGAEAIASRILAAGQQNKIGAAITQQLTSDRDTYRARRPLRESALTLPDK